MADFEYFRAEESDQFFFLSDTKALFTEKSLQTCPQMQSSFGILLDQSVYPRKWMD